MARIDAMWWRARARLLLLLWALAGWLEARSDRAHAGQGLFEYAIGIALIAVIAMVAVKAFGTEIGNLFTRLLSRIQGVG